MRLLYNGRKFLRRASIFTLVYVHSNGEKGRVLVVPAKKAQKIFEKMSARALEFKKTFPPLVLCRRVIKDHYIHLLDNYRG